MRVTSPRFRMMLVAGRALATGSSVMAWKPKTHVHLAEVAYNDAVDDGKVTIFAVYYQNGTIRKDAGGMPVVIGTYNVNPAVLAAIKANPAQFRAASLARTPTRTSQPASRSSTRPARRGRARPTPT